MSEIAGVLRAAVEALDERGWGQGDFEDSAGRLCAEGAIRLGAGWPDPISYGTDYHAAGLAIDAAITLGNYLGTDAVRYNDRPGRTEAEVRATLLAAADWAEAQ